MVLATYTDSFDDLGTPSVAAEGDCNGTNGNAAVAACHPGVSEIQDACPDNDVDGDGFAAPDDGCLAAARLYG